MPMPSNAPFLFPRTASRRPCARCLPRASRRRPQAARQARLRHAWAVVLAAGVLLAAAPGASAGVASTHGAANAVAVRIASAETPGTGAGLRAHPRSIAPRKSPAVGDALTGRYRIRREAVVGDADGRPPVLHVRRQGGHWLLSQDGASEAPQALQAFSARDYESMFAGQVATARPQCAGSAFTMICRVEPGTRPDPTDDFRSTTGYFLFSTDVGVVELERLPDGGGRVADNDAGSRAPVPH